MPAQTTPSNTMASAPRKAGKSGSILLWARLAWGSVTLLSVLVFVASIHLALTVDLFAQMPVLASELDVALFSIFANNQLLASNAVLFGAIAQFLAFSSIGIFLFWRKSNDWLAILISAMFISIGAGMSPGVFFLPILRPVWHLPASLLQAILFSALLWFLYLFPNGRFVPSWTRPAALLWGLYAAAWLIWPQLNPHRAGNFTALLIFIAWTWTGIVAQIQRYRRNDGIEHQQQKWVLIGLFFTHLFFGSLVLTSATGLNQRLMAVTPLPITLINTLSGFSIVLIPISISLAILRYRLWDIDVWINRALVFGVLTAVILILYGLGVGLASVLLPTATNWFVPVLALIFIVLVVTPLYSRIQKWIDRLVPVNHLPEQEPQTTETAKPSWPIRLAQAVWLLMLAFAIWHIVTSFFSFEQSSQQMMREWLVQESTRGLSANTANNIGRFIVANGIWTLAISTATAALIFWRKRNDRMALYVAFLLLLAPFGITPGNSNPGPIEQALSFIGIGILFFFPFVFPTGQFVPRSWKWRGMLVVTILFLPILFFPLARLVRPDVTADEQSYLTFVFMLTAVLSAGMISQIFRYRTLSTSVQRRQTRWVLGAFAIQIAWFAWVAFWIGTFPNNLFFPESIMALITLLGALITSALLPLSIAIAILYDRLWQIDVVLNRTLVFGGLTVLVVLMYVLVVGILGALFQAGNNLLLSVLATGLIAVLFNPLRRRLQRSVNQFIYGQRDDPFAVMSELGRQLEMTAIPGETLPALVQTIGQTLKLPFVAIVLREGEVIVSEGTKTSSPLQSFPLVYQANTIGQLQVARRGNNEKFTVEEEHLLRSVARHAGTAVYAEQMTHQLQRSRERLVTTREEERRRLRRDLHDGLGPQLATLTVKVGAAQNLLRADPDGADHLLDQVKAETQKAVKEIRRVVNDLRPSALDQLGLLSALHEFVAQNQAGGTKITLHTPDVLPPLPAAVEVAAYRIVTEAIANTVRHAQARVCTIHMEIDETMSTTMNLKIDDDGRGLADNYESGVGLPSMRERAVEIGGSFEIQSKPGQGTRLAVRLPIAEDE